LTRCFAKTKNFDYFSYGQGNFSLSLETHVPDLHFQPGHFIDIHKQMRRVSDGIPVMALGRINSPSLAEQIITDGYGDLVGMARALIADGAFLRRMPYAFVHRILTTLRDLVIVDNTNTQRWEHRPYRSLAYAMGYKYNIVNLFDAGLDDDEVYKFIRGNAIEAFGLHRFGITS
jgi:hypothetical protein